MMYDHTMSYTIVRYDPADVGPSSPFSCRMYQDYKDLVATAKKWSAMGIPGYDPNSWRAFQLTKWGETIDVTQTVKQALGSKT